MYYYPRREFRHRDGPDGVRTVASEAGGEPPALLLERTIAAALRSIEPGVRAEDLLSPTVHRLVREALAAIPSSEMLWLTRRSRSC